MMNWNFSRLPAPGSRLLLFLLLAGLTNGAAYAQSASNRGWFLLDHTQKLGPKFNLTFDGQLRTGPEWRILETVILRPGLSYALTRTTGVGAGYAYIGTWSEGGDGRDFFPEHRLWEQVTMKYKVARTPVDHRLRLEQRFLSQEGDTRFSQRLRYRIRARIPLAQRKNEDRGTYLLLQDEVLVNVHRQNAVNGQFYDQNRAHVGIGFQWKPGVSIEGGYLHRYVEVPAARQHHIAQLSVFTTL